MILAPELILGAATLCSGLVSYIVSVEKRLNGKAALLRTLTEIKADQKEQGRKVEAITVAVARIEEHMTAGYYHGPRL